MIDNVTASVRSLSQIVPCGEEDKRQRLQIVIFGDDEEELVRIMKRMLRMIK